MADVLTVIWYVAALSGVVSVIVSIVRPAAHRPALLVGAVCFWIAGVLGILSIGVVFLVAAVICGVVAVRQTSATTTAGRTAD